MRLGNNIRKLRFEHGEMSQQELANRVGVTRVSIYSIESRRFIPSALLAFKIAMVFGKTFEQVFYIEEEQSESQQ